MRKMLADNLSSLREKRGWTQHDLAAAAETSVENIRNYEQKRRWPDPEILDGIAMALEVNSLDLLGGNTQSYLKLISDLFAAASALDESQLSSFIVQMQLRSGLRGIKGSSKTLGLSED